MRTMVRARCAAVVPGFSSSVLSATTPQARSKATPSAVPKMRSCRRKHEEGGDREHEHDHQRDLGVLEAWHEEQEGADAQGDADRQHDPAQLPAPTHLPFLLDEKRRQLAVVERAQADQASFAGRTHVSSGAATWRDWITG